MYVIPKMWQMIIRLTLPETLWNYIKRSWWKGRKHYHDQCKASPRIWKAPGGTSPATNEKITTMLPGNVVLCYIIWFKHCFLDWAIGQGTENHEKNNTWNLMGRPASVLLRRIKLDRSTVNVCFPLLSIGFQAKYITSSITTIKEVFSDIRHNEFNSEKWHSIITA